MDLDQRVENLEQRVAELSDELKASSLVQAELKSRLRQSEGMVTVLSQHSSDLTYIVNEDCRFTYVSPSICKLTQYEPDEILLAEPGAFIHVDDVEMVREAIRDAFKEPGTLIPINDHRVRHRDLKWLYFEGSAICMPDETDVDGVIVSCHDVTERKRQEETIYRQANYDTLTGLPNRLMFADRLGTALLRGRRERHKVGLLFIDLDGFKKVNDTLGHNAGDDLLTEVARRLQACVRQDDTIARLGGDEFTVILPNIREPHDTEIVAKKVIERVREPIYLGDNEVYVSASIGITLYPDDAEDEETLIKHADTAMYEAKAAGRRTYKFFTANMNQAAQEKMELESELRAAIDRDEFDIRYQPIIDLKSGRITGTEALVRWNHPTRGFTSPDLFIPLAEEQGMIVAIGEWVFRQACCMARQWREDGHDNLQMAVNVSPRQCQEPDFGEMIERILEETGLPSSGVTLEITESLFIEGAHETAVSALHGLRHKGSLLSLDDFGTGYSSLSYLKRFPVDVLKIDREFVNDVTTAAEDQALCQAVIAMAHAFELNVVGEGVETLDHARVLRDMGCDRAQGYLISKPLSGAELQTFIHEWDGIPL
jgi:diguanylate cyclase (GGDEF)-like protein/PAS domain S-box-containing protein